MSEENHEGACALNSPGESFYRVHIQNIHMLNPHAYHFQERNIVRIVQVHYTRHRDAQMNR